MTPITDQRATQIDAPARPSLAPHFCEGHYMGEAGCPEQDSKRPGFAARFGTGTLARRLRAQLRQGVGNKGSKWSCDWLTGHLEETAFCADEAGSLKQEQLPATFGTADAAISLTQQPGRGPGRATAAGAEIGLQNRMAQAPWRGGPGRGCGGAAAGAPRWRGSTRPRCRPPAPPGPGTSPASPLPAASAAPGAPARGRRWSG